ncbi:MAG: phage Gp37/Gp68 family protein [Rhabdaerophilum sp.]
MADNTKIEWSDATWNPVNGCSLASPGCTNCYAMKQAHRVPQRRGLTQPSKGGMVWTGEVRFDEAKIDQPLRWKRPRMIFVCAHGDLFHEKVPDEWIDRVFAVMALCPQHTFQVLTKRSARMREYVTDKAERHRARPYDLDWHLGDHGDSLAVDGASRIDMTEWPLPNVWLGVSVEDQQHADERIPDLLVTPAAIRWISAEPLLGPVDLDCPTIDWMIYPTGHGIGASVAEGGEGKLLIDWVVAGGESGPGARPMHPDWARSLRDQCAAADVPFFFKQWGEWGLYDAGWHDFTDADPSGVFGAPGSKAAIFFNNGSNPVQIIPLGKKRAGRLLDGVEHNGMPEQANA